MDVARTADPNRTTTALEVGAAAQFAGNHEATLGPTVLPGAAFVLGGSIRLGASPVEIRLRGSVGNLGELFAAHGGVGVGIALGRMPGG